MEWTAEQINEHLDKFLPIETCPIPDGEKVTIWCDSGEMETSGFAENTTYDELGLNALIAKSWILQSELDKLCEGKENHSSPSTIMEVHTNGRVGIGT
jgi:hypothetical protein